ncbi:hypothetical protein F66182_860 [Fusarium sp. NRRL 66182]|nr:hypothetical protein F66182_860 [Fusarium sp. NRRL 66182]
MFLYNTPQSLVMSCILTDKKKRANQLKHFTRGYDKFHDSSASCESKEAHDLHLVKPDKRRPLYLSPDAPDLSQRAQPLELLFLLNLLIMAAEQHVNLAAVLPVKQGMLTIRERPIPTPGQGELLVQTEVVAANPSDWMVQSLGVIVTKFPAVLCSDLAGVVVSAGPGVTRFQPGDRVMGFAVGMVQENSDEAALQNYTILKETATSHLPNNITFEQGAALPVAMTTASVMLFADLELPMRERNAQELGAILVWSGASAVGVAAIQIAHALGWSVYATASPKHHGWLKRLGATNVWDYHDPDVAQVIGKAARAAGFKIRGVVDARSQGSSFDLVAATLIAADSCSGTRISTVLPWPEDKPKPQGVQVAGADCFRFQSDRQDIAQWLFGHWLKQSLEDGIVEPAPEPRVIEGGLGGAQKMLDTLKAGVSGEKLVLKL